MAQGLSDTILVAIRITLQIRESKVRNPDRSDYSKNLCHAVFGRGLCSLSASSWVCFYFLDFFVFFALPLQSTVNKDEHIAVGNVRASSLLELTCHTQPGSVTWHPADVTFPPVF